jgi:hypothetical protein
MKIADMIAKVRKLSMAQVRHGHHVRARRKWAAAVVVILACVMVPAPFAYAADPPPTSEEIKQAQQQTAIRLTAYERAQTLCTHHVLSNREMARDISMLKASLANLCECAALRAASSADLSLLGAALSGDVRSPSTEKFASSVLAELRICVGIKG